MTFVHQQAEKLEAKSLVITKQSDMIKNLIITIEKESTTNEQQSFTIEKQSALILRFQEETAVSKGFLVISTILDKIPCDKCNIF